MRICVFSNAYLIGYCHGSMGVPYSGQNSSIFRHFQNSDHGDLAVYTVGGIIQEVCGPIMQC